MTDPRWFARLPSHIWVLLGASTAGYALLLAGVAGLQSQTEASLAASRQPAADGIVELAAGNDALLARLDAARADYARTAGVYTSAGGKLDALHGHVDALAAMVAEIDGVSRSLPTSVKLPAVRSSVSSVKVPRTSGTTGASGG
ncbi:MAG TPA: hypothetical protein VIF63_05530 [Candidatus Limnocylindrales bacterium]|jgi:hypothetical protein